MEEPITFKNLNGEKITGIVHIPEHRRSGYKRVGINLLNPGIKYRVAPNRLYVKIARRLCQQGYYILRFDPAGIGDSEGEIPENPSVLDIWAKIQTGMFVSDTLIANDFFVRKYDITELVLAGSCGGAITSVLAGAQDQKVHSLCLIDVPIFLGSASMSFADLAVVGGERVERFFSEYVKKIWSVKHWYRLVRLQTDFRALFKIVGMKLRAKLVLGANQKRLPENIGELCRQKKLNKRFFDCISELLERRKPILFILADNDHGTELFQYYFQNGYLKERYNSFEYDDTIEIFVVENANHVYTLSESQKTLIDKVTSWVSIVHPF